MEETANLAQVLKCCNVDQLARLVGMNPDFPNSPDPNGLYPLHYAALYGNSEVLKCLISQHGSDFNCITAEKTTPLHFAARNGSTECVKILLDFNASVNEADQMGWTPLHYACYRGYTDIAMQLIRKGSDLNLHTVEGYTPLHISCYKGNTKLIEDLINKNADVNARDKRGETPLELLQLFKREEPVPASPPISEISSSLSKGKIKSMYDNESERDSITPPFIAEFSPVNEEFSNSGGPTFQTVPELKPKFTVQSPSKTKSKPRNSEDDDDDDDDNDDNYDDNDGANKKKPKKKEEHEKHSTTPGTTQKAVFQLTFKVGNAKQPDQKHQKLTSPMAPSSSSLSTSLHISLPSSSSKSSTSSHVKAEAKDSAAASAGSGAPPAKKPRHSSTSGLSSPQEVAADDTHKKQPKSSKKSTKRTSISSSSTGPSSPQTQHQQTPLGAGANRTIASTVVNSHSSRSFLSSSSLISLDDDPLFGVCDCFKLIMSSACPQEVKKAIKSTNSTLKEKIDYLLDSHNTSVCLSIIEKLRTIDIHKFFEEPVTVNIAPDYFRYVKSPMDIKTLEDYVVRKKIISVKEFIIWGRQIWQSCFTFNTKKDMLFVSGKEYSLEFENYIRTADWRHAADSEKVMSEVVSSWDKILTEFDDETREQISKSAGVPELDPYKYFDDIRVGFFCVPTRELKYKE